MTKVEKDKIRKKILDGSIYKTKQYKSWRTKIFQRDRFTCQLCNKCGGSIQAHHIYKKYKHPELIYSLKNGITLCFGCHQEIHKQEAEQKYRKILLKKARENKPKPKVRRIKKTFIRARFRG